MEHLVSIPAQLVTSLMLTIFITFDMASLKQGASRLAPFYSEVAPSLLVFGRLLGRAFSAQALIALFNTLLTFLLLWSLGIKNELLLCSIVFFASFIPVLGVLSLLLLSPCRLSFSQVAPSPWRLLQLVESS